MKQIVFTITLLFSFCSFAADPLGHENILKVYKTLVIGGVPVPPGTYDYYDYKGYVGTWLEGSFKEPMPWRRRWSMSDIELFVGSNVDPYHRVNFKTKVPNLHFAADGSINEFTVRGSSIGLDFNIEGVAVIAPSEIKSEDKHLITCKDPIDRPTKGCAWGVRTDFVTTAKLTKTYRLQFRGVSGELLAESRYFNEKYVEASRDKGRCWCPEF